MQFGWQATPWWERHDVTIKFGEGQTLRTRCAGTGCNENKVRFGFSDSPEIMALAEKQAPAEISEFINNGIGTRWYRVSTYSIDAEERRSLYQKIELECEPIPGPTMGSGPNNAKLSVQEKILGVLKSAPDGMSARDIAEQVPDCSTRWVFNSLARLVQTGSVEKRGALYRLSVP
jgi:hypothetical protein